MLDDSNAQENKKSVLYWPSDKLSGETARVIFSFNLYVSVRHLGVMVNHSNGLSPCIIPSFFIFLLYVLMSYVVIFRTLDKKTRSQAK